MAKRRASQRSPSPFMVDIRFKLLRIVQRHEQMKIAFNDLKSQIKSGLLEAEDVFTSLSIPLMKLVGLKTEEMAEEGRSTTIFMESDFQQVTKKCYFHGVNLLFVTAPFFLIFISRISFIFCSNLKEKNYITRALKAGNQLTEKQHLQLQKLVYLLKRIEVQVNSRQDNLLQNLNDHGLSLRKFFQRSVFYLSNVHRMNQTHETTINVTLKLLRATFDHMNLVLGSVEDGVKDLMRELAEHMCTPMVDYVKELKAEMGAGTLKRLIDVVNEIERVMIDGQSELVEAKKKVRLEESRKLEALSRLKESEEKRRALKELVVFLISAKEKTKESFVPHKFLTMEEDRTVDERSVPRVALKKKNRIQLQTSPWGAEELLNIMPGKKSRQLRDKGNISTMVGLEHMVNHRPRTRAYAREQPSPGTPFTDSWPRLG
ncbi:hypothetical protein BVC80_1837g174 [Macleaya cordata]|uniref:Uncharacterized protein n=1 Tax=Macleaya cordata TaxID=56857 RepID=A0A200R3R9_MACCD|nr:hypothetical protein BVC80_1837g174 [Macleaya cordata]